MTRVGELTTQLQISDSKAVHFYSEVRPLMEMLPEKPFLTANMGFFVFMSNKQDLASTFQRPQSSTPLIHFSQKKHKQMLLL